MKVEAVGAAAGGTATGGTATGSTRADGTAADGTARGGTAAGCLPAAFGLPAAMSSAVVRRATSTCAAEGGGGGGIAADEQLPALPLLEPVPAAAAGSAGSALGGRMTPPSSVSARPGTCPPRTRCLAWEDGRCHRCAAARSARKRPPTCERLRATINRMKARGARRGCAAAAQGLKVSERTCSGLA